jgi:hypothetical protein
MPNLFLFPVLSPSDLDSEGFPAEEHDPPLEALLDSLEVAA